MSEVLVFGVVDGEYFEVVGVGGFGGCSGVVGILDYGWLLYLDVGEGVVWV